MKQIITISIIALIFASCNQQITPEQIQKKTAGYEVKIAKLEKKIEELVALDTTSAAQKVFPIKVVKLAKDTIDRKITYSANLIPYDEVYLAPAAVGKIVSINVEVGDKVKKGQKLVQMDQTQLVQAKIQLESLKKDYDRIKTLKESGTIAEQQYDQIKTQYELTKSNVEFLEENTVVIAPFDGVITGKFFENGESFSGAPNTQAGKAAIVKLEKISVLKAIINVPENYYTALNEGTKVEVLSDVYPNTPFTGVIENVYPTIDPLTRSFKIEIKIPNGSMQLRPGMFSRSTIVTGISSSIIVPANTVLQQEGTNTHYVFINNNNVAKRVNVTLGDRFNDAVEIISDELSEGQELIAVGQAVLMNGNKVKVVK